MIALGDMPGDELGLLQAFAEIGQHKYVHLPMSVKGRHPRESEGPGRHRRGPRVLDSRVRGNDDALTDTPRSAAPPPVCELRPAGNVARAAAAASPCPSR